MSYGTAIFKPTGERVKILRIGYYFMIKVRFPNGDTHWVYRNQLEHEETIR